MNLPIHQPGYALRSKINTALLSLIICFLNLLMNLNQVCLIPGIRGPQCVLVQILSNASLKINQITFNFSVLALLSTPQNTYLTPRHLSHPLEISWFPVKTLT